MERSWQYGSWFPHSLQTPGVIQPLTPADGLPEGRTLTDEDRKTWRALWADRLTRGVKPSAPVSVFHSTASPCKGVCPNRVHESDAA